MDPTNPWLKKSGSNGITASVNEKPNNSSKITSSHLLASNYVPNNLRAINTAPVSAHLNTKAVPSMEKEIERVFCGLLGEENPRPPGSIDNGSNNDCAHSDDDAKMKEYHKYKQQQANQRPAAVKTINEARFVDDLVQKRFVELKAVSKSVSKSITPTKNPVTNITSPNGSGNRGNADPVEAAAAKIVPLIGTDMVPGGRDQVGTTQHYLAVFRELLQLEYAEIQRLYVKDYNNYQVKVTTADIGVGQFKMKGIADGRPSIRPGDVVLVRPHGLINLPSWNPYDNCNNTAYNNVNNSYTHPGTKHIPYPQQAMILPNQQPHSANPVYHNQSCLQMVEITARVLAINRGKKKKEDGQPAKDQVLLSWIEDPRVHQQIQKRFCAVRFIPSTATHERCLTALDWLRSIDPVVARDLLFPSKAPKLPPPPAIDESNADADTTDEREYEQLNKNQARFVQMVVARTAHPSKERVRPPMVLTGPAGTGKTKTLLATILQILRRNQTQQRQQQNPKDTKPLHYRILICTPSHTACDVITERLANLLSANKPLDQVRKMVFRLYDATRKIETVPVQILPYTRQVGDGGQFSLPDPQQLLGLSVIVCTCYDAHLLFLAGLTNSTLRRRRETLKSDTERRLKESGLELCGTIEGCNTPHFTHLFIDEAAQATEPECLIPLSVVVDDDSDAMKAEIALCGDPRQLGPCIYSPDAIEGLQRSLLERLLRLPVDTYGGGRDHLMGPPTADSRLTLDEMIEYSFQKTDYQENLSVFLNLSYRGHPSFLFMPSKLFYFDKLKSICPNSSEGNWMEAVRKIELLTENAYPESLSLKQMDWPLVFRGVKGKCSSMAIEACFRSNCWCNYAEATVVVQIIEEVRKARVSTASIGVMAPFRAQVVLIRKLLRAKNLSGVNVGMVEDYQSMERDIIVLSLTRTNKSLVHADVISGEGLFHQNKRMNVALTRAQHALIVVGEPSIMKDDIAWAHWLEFCKDNGLWYGETGEET